MFVTFSSQCCVNLARKNVLRENDVLVKVLFLVLVLLKGAVLCALFDPSYASFSVIYVTHH